MNTRDQHDLDQDSRLQARAEHAERAGLPPGDDSRVDRYRLIVRALREPLEPQLPADFAVRVANEAARRGNDVFEDVVVSLLLLGLGLGALTCLLPALAKAVQEIATVRLPSMPLQQMAMAAVGIGVVWAIERGWMRLHPTAPRR